MRTLARLATIAALAYALVALVYYLAQDRLIFYPMPKGDFLHATATQPISLARDGIVLDGVLVNPHLATPTVFYFGGNAERITSHIDRFRTLPARTVLLPYRGYEGNPGAPSQRAMVGDAVQALRTFATAQAIVVGRSIGSGVAALAAAEAGNIDALLLVSPFCSFANVVALHAPAFLPARLLLSHPFEVAAIADHLPRRVGMVIAASDTIVPPAESACLARALGATDAVIEIPGAGHNDVFASDVIWQALAAMVETVSISAALGERPLTEVGGERSVTEVGGERQRPAPL